MRNTLNRLDLRVVAIVLAALGMADASYLTVVHYAHIQAICMTGHDGCETVAKLSYSMLGSVPVSLWGLATYVLLLGTSLGRSERARVAAVALTTIGAAFSYYLTYLELFVIHAICQWCVGSATIMTISAIVAYRRFFTAPGMQHPHAES